MKLSIEKLLELLPDGKVDRRGKNIICSCPFCGGNEFGISLDEGHRYGCYRKAKCGQVGNIVTLLKYLGKYDWIISEKATKLSGRIEIETLPLENLDLNTPIMNLPLGWKKLQHHSYLESRGFQKEDYDRYLVGSTLLDHRLKNDYVIFSVLEDGENKGHVARHIWSKQRIEAYNKVYFEKTGIKDKIKRFRNSLSDFAKLVYGIDEIIIGETKTIIAVEGIFDKIGVDRLLKLGEQSYMKCNATFKCNVSDEQIAKWQNRGIENLILLYDPDVIKVIKHNIERLQKYFNVWVGYSVSGRDPGDMTEEDIEYVMDHLEDPTQFKINKLEVSKL
jgi:DNA primase